MRMSGLSLRLSGVFHTLFHGVRSARPGEVEAVLFPASPFRLENELTGTDCPSREAPVKMTEIGYCMVSVGGSFRSL
jgi:hypothetical protein